MSDEPAGAVTGKTFNLSLVGDDFHTFTTLKDIYEGQREQDDARVEAALNDLPPDVRALVSGRMTTTVRKELSQKEVFVRALNDALSHQDALHDAEAEVEAEEAEAAE